MESKNSCQYKLSPEEIQFYADNGYLIIRELFDTTAFEKLRKRFHQIVNREVPRGMISIRYDLELKKKFTNPEQFVNKINLITFDPEFMKFTEDPKLVDVLSQLLSEEMIIMNSMLINKPPGTPSHPPHQDMFHIPLRPVNKVLTTWTAIDESTEDNGCLFVIPGSHKDNIIHEEHTLPEFLNLYYTIKDLEAIAPKEKWIPLPMRPGDTLFINSLLVHGSFPNTSKSYRKAITSVYASGECEFFDVTGTVQEPFMLATMNELKEKGYPVKDSNYLELWKPRTKTIRKME